MDYKISQVHPYFDEDEINEAVGCLKRAWVTEGPKKEEFVKKILEFTGAKYGVLAPNGTQALYLALMVAGIGRGNEVLVPDFSFIASGSAVYWAEAKPVFVDVLKETLNIDPSLCEKYITKKTRAIMPVHIYGQSADMDPIMELAQKHNLVVIEDAAQGLGVFYKGKHTGTIGHLGCMSFFADKTITTGGEGGMVFTNDDKMYEGLKFFRNHGRLESSTFYHSRVGYNLRMTDIQCAVGLAQLRKFSKLKNHKLKCLDLYKENLKDIKQVKFLDIAPYSNIVPFRANIFMEDLENAMRYLEENGIQMRKFFYPLHCQPFFNQKYDYNSQDFPVSKYAYEHGLSLPVHMYIKEEDIQYICNKIKEFYQK